MQGKDTASTLNDLITVSEDGEKGFREAAEIATDARFRSFFGDAAAHCAKGAAELREFTANFGSNATSSEGDGSLAGALHRGFVKVKSMLEDENLAALEEVERGQDHAKAAYEKALKADLDGTVRAAIERQYQGVKLKHDEAKALRDGYKAASERS